MSNKKPKIIIIIGRSGCGKGTQAKLLIKEFGFEYLGSGDLLRKRGEKDDFSGEKIKKVMDSGKRIPTPIMFRIWAERIEEMKDEVNKKGLIVDGNPRSLREAELMKDAFEWYEWKDTRAIVLDISEQEAFDRLTKRRICKACGRLIPWVGNFKEMKICDECGGELITRADDNPEAIKARLAYYKKDVEPAIDYYEKQDKLIRVDGDKPIEDVYYDIKKAVE